MTHTAPDILEVSRLPALCRGVCLYAGLPLPSATSSSERFVVRSGTEPPGLLARLLREGLADDGIDVHDDTADGESDPEVTGRARVLIRPGFAAPCPEAAILRKALAVGDGAVLLFAVERRNPAGRLLGVTWAAVPEEEPLPRERFRAAVRSCECDPSPRPEEIDTKKS